MDLSRIRKALVAGGMAALAILGTQVVKDGVPANTDGWFALVGSMLGAFVVAAGATFSVRNAGSDIGPTGSTTTRI